MASIAGTQRAAIAGHGGPVVTLACLALVAVTVVALTSHALPSRWPLQVVVAAAVPVAGFAGTAGLVLAGLTTRWWLAAIAAVTLLWWAGLVAPGVVAQGAPDRPAGTTLRVLTSNVLAGNPDLRLLLDRVVAGRPDLVALQEITPAHAKLLDSPQLKERFPYRIVDARDGFHGGAILSRHRLSDRTVVWPGGWPMTSALLSTPAGDRLRVINVHTAAPLTGEQLRVWRTQLRELRRMALAAGSPALLLGDFNATRNHRELRTLIAPPLREAHRRSAVAWNGTWPATGPLGGVLRLDHVIAGPGVDITGAAVMRMPGSDHRAVTAEATIAR